MKHTTSCDGADNWSNPGSFDLFFAIFLTKRMSIAEERLHSEHVREMQHERLLTEILDHLRSLEHHPRSRAP